MAWPPTVANLERARDELRKQAEDDPWWGPLEQLGRTHRWLDEDAEASRRFREAAADLEDALRSHGREDGYQIAQVACLLWLAGDGDGARPWAERALRTGPARNVAAAMHYLAGDHERAAAVAREAAEDPDDRPYPWAEALEVLAIACRDRDGDRATRARETFAELIRQDRTPPSEASGSASLSLFDWYEEAARAEASLHGEQEPGHAELLARLES
jgi:tetratricopeptide (TPR) repeat protein